MNTAVILLGSNTGNLSQNLNQALSLIAENIGSIGKISHIYQTEPWGRADQPYFYNQVAEVFTALDAYNLLDKLLGTEAEMGRKRTEKWAPRSIDLDILYFNDVIINGHGLTIPHPHLHERRFTLEPLTEILPEMIHPLLKKRNKDLLGSLKDDLRVKKLISEIPFNH